MKVHHGECRRCGWVGRPRFDKRRALIAALWHVHEVHQGARPGPAESRPRGSL